MEKMIKMKIKINKNKKRNSQQILKTVNKKRIRLPNKIRFAVIGFLGLLLLFSAFTLNAAYSKPELTEKSREIMTYSQHAYFNYKVYLEESTVYEGKEYLNPGEGVNFRQIIDHITGNFSYFFNVYKQSQISGVYSLKAKLSNELWNKSYILIPSTRFEDNGDSASFSIEFPIDYEFYERIIKDINLETGIDVVNPKLEIVCQIGITAKTGEETIYKSFSPSILVTLNQKRVDISDELSFRDYGSKTETEDIFHQEVENERNTWTSNMYLFIGLIVIVLLFTKSDKEVLGKKEKQVKRINKKFGEWIVDVEKQPNRTLGSDIVYTKTMDDLMKISEEIGKPVIHFESENNHTYYVIDESIQYQYLLTSEGKISKKVKCPYCQTTILTKGKPGETIKIKCPNCEKTGETTI